MEENVKKGKKGLIITLISLAVVLVLAVAAYFIVSDMNAKNEAARQRQAEQEAERLQFVESKTFLEGISINGVDVGGLTMDQAKEKLMETQSQALSEANFQVTYESTAIPLKAEDFGMGASYDNVLNEAFSLGKSGTYDEIMSIVNDAKENGKNFEAPLAYSDETIDGIVNKIAEKIDRDPVDAQLSLSADKKTMEYTEAQTGLTVDRQKLAETLRQKLDNQDYEDVQAPVNVTEPQVTQEELSKTITKRSEANTSFASGHYSRATRVFNIEKASGLINGVIVKPGEVFSMNDTIGPRTYALGWKPAPAIIEGGARSEDQAGGGVCQVSSTLYNAVLKADLEIVYRQPHSSKLGYVLGGLDATINTGTIDFQWKNNTNNDIVIMSWVADKKVYVELYGEGFGEEFDEIKLTSKQVGTIKPSGDVEIVVDKSKKPGYKETYSARKNGTEWKSYKHYYKDGKEVKTELIAVSRYKAVRGKIIVGPDKPEETETPKPTETPGETQVVAPVTPDPAVTKTPKPAKTEDPVVTKTPKPAKTEAPAKTEEPAVTKKPKPAKTEKPAEETKPPKATKKPAEKPKDDKTDGDKKAA